MAALEGAGFSAEGDASEVGGATTPRPAGPSLGGKGDARPYAAFWVKVSCHGWLRLGKVVRPPGLTHTSDTHTHMHISAPHTYVLLSTPS